MNKFLKENNEVLYLDDEIVVINNVTIQKLKSLAIQNQRQRIRLCVHKSPSEKLHEMFIIHSQCCYVRPHKHIQKTESMTVLEGEVDVILFNEIGEIYQVNSLGSPSSGKNFFQRLPENTYHMLIIKSEILVFHEITSGPFFRENTIFPDWAPSKQGSDSLAFVKKIETLIIEKANDDE